MSHKDLDIQFGFFKLTIPDLDIQFGFMKWAIKDIDIQFGFMKWAIKDRFGNFKSNMFTTKNIKFLYL